MITGTGIDVIEIVRIERAHRRWGEAFLRKVFTDSEIAYCFAKAKPYPSLAARFAAKEAGYKALSQTGVHIVKWRSLWVENDQYGRPRLRVAMFDLPRLHLSLTHSRDYAAAVVIAEKHPLFEE